MGFEIENGVLKKYTEENGVTEVVIPDSVTSIGKRAFFRCFSLTSVTIPDSVTSIGKCAFYICSSLTSVTIPDSVTSISACAFNGCSSLTSVTIPDSVTSIGVRAFYKCRKLASVTIPDSITSIGESAFSCCNMIKSITIKSNDSSVTINDSGMIKYFGDLNVNARKLLDFIANQTDKKDTILSELTETPYKIVVALYLIRKYDDCESAKKFAEDNIEAVVCYLIDNEDVENLMYVLTLGYVTDENIDSMIKYAIDNEKTEMQVILTDYKNEHFGFADSFDKFML